MSPVFDLVVAHHSASLEWISHITNRYPSIGRVWVYCKGPKGQEGLKNLPDQIPCEIIHLKNSGREGHTYLYHIRTQYDRLPNRIVFTVDTVSQYPDRMKKLEKACATSGTVFPVLVGEDTTFRQGFGIKHYRGRPISTAKTRPFGKWYRQWIQGTFVYLKANGVSYNGIFSVTGETIRRHSRDHYHRLEGELLDSEEAGHFMERSWKTMWLGAPR